MPARSSSREAFTLLEVLVALVVLGVGILGLSANAALVSRLVGDGSRLTLAATVATSRLEELRALPCAGITSGSAITRGIEERWSVGPMAASGRSALEVELSVTYPLRATGRADSSRTQRFRGAAPVRPMTPFRRSGVTLVELVVALTLFGVVATIMLSVLRGQQRFHLGSLEIIDTKRNVHQAAELLYGELRAAATADIYAISDSSVSFRTPLGNSHICSVDSARSLLTLPSTRTTRAAALSAFLAMPRPGDSLLVFDAGESMGADDDRWHPYVIAVGPGAGACPRRPFGLASDATEAAGISLTIAPSLAPSVGVGSPVRFFRPASYALYRGTGSTWMLGYSLCAAGACTPRQPLSGPYLPFASGGGGGIAFQFFDREGALTSDRSRVARIDLVVRARSPSALDVGHIRRQRYQDSLGVTVALRNRL